MRIDKPKFKAGDLCCDKTNSRIKMVIKRRLDKKDYGLYRYLVGWYDNGQFYEGYSYESELELWEK